MNFPTLEHPSSLSDQAYKLIREAIRIGDLKPDDKVTERGLAKKLAVSATPIREALKRLEQEGLIRRKGQKSLVVSKKNEAAMVELVRIRASLAGNAARFAAEKISNDEIGEIQQLLESAQKMGQTATGEELLKLARRFHEIVNHASRNEVLIQFLETTAIFDESHRLLTLNAEMQYKSSHLERSFIEHKRIFAAIQSRDGDLAEKLMVEHILRTSNVFFKHLEK